MSEPAEYSKEIGVESMKEVRAAMQTSHVPSGYSIGRDSNSLTTREREVLGCIAQGMMLVDAAAKIGVSKQRVDQIVKALEKKGVLTKVGNKFSIQIERAK